MAEGLARTQRRGSKNAHAHAHPGWDSAHDAGPAAAAVGTRPGHAETKRRLIHTVLVVYSTSAPKISPHGKAPNRKKRGDSLTGGGRQESKHCAAGLRRGQTKPHEQPKHVCLFFYRQGKNPPFIPNHRITAAVEHLSVIFLLMTKSFPNRIRPSSSCRWEAAHMDNRSTNPLPSIALIDSC